MAAYVRRRVVSIQLSIAAAALGVLAGVGLGKGSQPPQIESDLARNNVITIHGSNIADGSVKYQDLDKSSLQKHIYLKVQVDKQFVKLSQADGIIQKVITNNLAGFIKLRDADLRYLKVEALNGYLKLTDADARFLKLDALDGYVKLDTLNNYVKLSDADTRYLKLDALDSYLKVDAADARYLKTGALDGYIKIDALSDYVKLDDANAEFLKLDDVDGAVEKVVTEKLGPYLKVSDAQSVIEKIVSDDGYLKASAADTRYVNGNGSVVTGSHLATPEPQTLITLGKTMAMDDWNDQGSSRVNVKLTNLFDGSLEYASNAPDAAKGGDYHGVIDKGGTETILIALDQPTTIQIVPGSGAATAVHTVSVTAMSVPGGKVQVVAQALSGAPPAG
jgi:hypothetical protein